MIDFLSCHTTNLSFVCLFLGIENPPFLLYSILALTIDDSKIRTWRNEYQTKLQRKYFIPVAFEILCFTLMETLDFFASCSKYSSPIASWVEPLFGYLTSFQEGFTLHSLTLHWTPYFRQLSACLLHELMNKCVMNIMFKAFDLV